MKSLPLLLWPALGVLVGACQNDGAHLNISGEPMAVDSYLPFEVIDSCSGGGKINFCTTEQLVTLDSFAVEDPLVAEIIPAANVPPGLLSSTVTRAIHGLAPGKTTVRATATFDDGSVREATAKLDVAAISRATLETSCEPGAERENVLPPDQLASFTVYFFAGAVRLVGQLDRPIDYDMSLAMLMRGFPSTFSHPFFWRTPATPLRLKVTSRLDPRFSSVLDVYGPERVTQVEVAGLSGPPPYFISSFGGAFLLGAKVKVDGKRPCGSHALVAATTLTPAICTGPPDVAGQTSWTSATADRISFSPVAEGTCRLSLGVVGGAARNVVEIPYRLIHQSNRGVGADEPCLTVGEVACAHSRGAILVCSTATDTTGNSGRWRLRQTCTPRICDYLPPGERGCSDPVECIQCI